MFLSPLGPFAETLIVAVSEGCPAHVVGKVICPDVAVGATLLTSTWQDDPAFGSIEVETCPPKFTDATGKVVGSVQVTVRG